MSFGCGRSLEYDDTFYILNQSIILCDECFTSTQQHIFVYNANPLSSYAFAPSQLVHVKCGVSCEKVGDDGLRILLGETE